ncbi:hypothetical protein D3C72_1552670 [compost metagenome]
MRQLVDAGGDDDGAPAFRQLLQGPFQFLELGARAEGAGRVGQLIGHLVQVVDIGQAEQARIVAALIFRNVDGDAHQIGGRIADRLGRRHPLHPQIRFMQRVIGQVFRAQAALQMAAKLSVAFQEQLAQSGFQQIRHGQGTPGKR